MEIETERGVLVVRELCNRKIVLGSHGWNSRLLRLVEIVDVELSDWWEAAWLSGCCHGQRKYVLHCDGVELCYKEMSRICFTQVL